MNEIMIGIDGGGTVSSAIACDLSGRELSRSRGSGINFAAIGAERAAENLISTLGLLKLPENAEIKAVSIGSSALDDFASVPGEKEFVAAIKKHLPSKCSVFMKSDAYMALYGLCGDAPGSLLISGTGVIGMAKLSSGVLLPISGWGERLADEGSGYYIGFEGLRLALRHADGIEEHKALYERMMSFYRLSSPRELIAAVYSENADKSVVASFSKEVSLCAASGDSDSFAILNAAAAVLSKLAIRLIGAVGSEAPFGIYGSVLKNDILVRRAFIDGLSAVYPDIKPRLPEKEPELAAVGYARAALGIK